jgi:hypothetical protein
MVLGANLYLIKVGLDLKMTILSTFPFSSRKADLRIHPSHPLLSIITIHSHHRLLGLKIHHIAKISETFDRCILVFFSVGQLLMKLISLEEGHQMAKFKKFVEIGRWYSTALR